MLQAVDDDGVGVEGNGAVRVEAAHLFLDLQVQVRQEQLQGLRGIAAGEEHGLQLLQDLYQLPAVEGVQAVQDPGGVALHGVLAQGRDRGGDGGQGAAVQNVLPRLAEEPAPVQLHGLPEGLADPVQSGDHIAAGQEQAVQLRLGLPVSLEHDFQLADGSRTLQQQPMDALDLHGVVQLRMGAEGEPLGQIRQGGGKIVPQHHLIAGSLQAQLLQGNAIGWQLPLENIADQGGSGHFAVMLGGAVPAGFLIQLGFELPQQLFQLLLVDGLGQVALHPIADGLLGIGKIGKAGDDQHFSPEALLLGAEDDLQSGQSRHPDVHQHHVGLKAEDLFQRLFPAGSLAAYGKAQGLIIQQALNALPDQSFVVRNQNPIHTAASFLCIIIQYPPGNVKFDG